MPWQLTCSPLHSYSSCYHPFRILYHCYCLCVLSFSPCCALDFMHLCFYLCRCNCSYLSWDPHGLSPLSKLSFNLPTQHLPQHSTTAAKLLAIDHHKPTSLGLWGTSIYPTCDNSWWLFIHLMQLWEKANSLIFANFSTLSSCLHQR